MFALDSRSKLPQIVHQERVVNNYSALDTMQFDVVMDGVKSISAAMNEKAISKQQADDLIGFLVASYASELISRQVDNYLNDSLSVVCEQLLEELEYSGERK